MKNKRSIYYTRLIAGIAALGGFLFGFDMAVISGIIEPVKKQFNLSSIDEGLFVSSALAGCIIGVAFSGYLSDKIGRKKVLFISAMLFVFSALGFSFSHSYSYLIVYRILAGMGVGVASNISPLYISEVAPPAKRGGLVIFFQLAVTAGIVSAYLSNLILQQYAGRIAAEHAGLFHWLFSQEVWRGMFLVGIIPAILFSSLLLIVPESPRWLALSGRSDQALQILNRLNGEEKGPAELKAISENVFQTKSVFKELMKPKLRKLLIMAVLLSALSQFSGINAVIYYGPTVLKSAGFVTNDALLYQLILGTANFLFTFLAIWKVDTWGRRPLYIFGSLFSGIALLLTAGCFMFGLSGPLLLTCIMLFLLFFAFSLGPLKFVIATEIFPTHIRGTAVSVCIMAMWLSDWIVNLFFPQIRDSLGTATTFLIFSVFCFLSFFYAKARLVETKGKTLEEINRID